VICLSLRLPTVSVEEAKVETDYSSSVHWLFIFQKHWLCIEESKVETYYSSSVNWSFIFKKHWMCILSPFEVAKVIDRAKGLIMAQPGCREEEAYASLRRQAMESSSKIADFAKDVLTVSEVLKDK
jgi:hypothetical protein